MPKNNKIQFLSLKGCGKIQKNCVQLLLESPQPLTIDEMTTALKDVSSIVRLSMTALKKRGFVKRERDPRTTAYRFVWSLTPEGAAVAKASSNC